MTKDTRNRGGSPLKDAFQFLRDLAGGEDDVEKSFPPEDAPPVEEEQRPAPPPRRRPAPPPSAEEGEPEERAEEEGYEEEPEEGEGEVVDDDGDGYADIEDDDDEPVAAAEDEDRPAPPLRKSELIDQLLKSEFADRIDDSDALIHVVNTFAEQLDGFAEREIALQGEMAELRAVVKSLGDLPAQMAELLEGQVLIGKVVAKSHQQGLAMAKSLGSVQSDVALVKSQPANTFHGAHGQPGRAMPVVPPAAAAAPTQGGAPRIPEGFAVAPNGAVTRNGAEVTNPQVMSAISKSVEAGELGMKRGGEFMASLSGKQGVAGVLPHLPGEVLARL